MKLRLRVEKQLWRVLERRKVNRKWSVGHYSEQFSFYSCKFSQCFERVLGFE